MNYDNTMLKDYKRCERLFYNKYEMGYIGEDESVHLHAGKCFANAVERARVAFYDGDMSLTDSILQGGEVLISSWGDPTLFASETKNLSRMMAAYEKYMDDFPIDHHPVHRGADGKLMVECHFALPWGKPELKTFDFDTQQWIYRTDGDVYSGTPDTVLEYGGGLWLVDEKTKGGSFTPTWISQWKRWGQYTGYVWGLGMKGVKLDGVLCRGIAIQKNQIKTIEVASPRAEWMVNEWILSTTKTIERIQESRKTGSWDGANDDNCVKYGRECEFIGQCTSPNPDYSKFKRGTWEPLTRQWVAR
jgi:hypothetical protein